MSIMTCKLSDECWCSECHTSRLAVHQLKDVSTLKRDFDKAVRDEDRRQSIERQVRCYHEIEQPPVADNAYPIRN